MAHVFFVSAARSLVVASVAMTLSGCWITAPSRDSKASATAGRLTAAGLPFALPPPTRLPATARATAAQAAAPVAANDGLVAAEPQTYVVTPKSEPRTYSLPAPAPAALAVPSTDAAITATPGSAQIPANDPALDAEMGAGIRAGQCWAQLVMEPVARRQTVQIVTEDGATRLHVQPPELRTSNRPVVVKEEAQTYRVEPPRFRQVTEQIKVKDEIRRLVVVPAVYENREEPVMVESARVVLESCRTSAQRAAGAGVASKQGSQAKCMRELPARFEAVTRRVLVRAESTREEVVPAVYSTITKWVLEEPARAVAKVVPASTRQLPLTEVVRGAQVHQQTVAPSTAALNLTQHEGMPQLVWRRAVCESEAMPEVVEALQKALQKNGLDVGAIDGKLGRRTMAAIVDFQRREGLAVGLVTFETMEKLGVLLPKS